MKYFFGFILVFIFFCANSQSTHYKVVDAFDGKALAFVNIVFDDGNKGVTSDMDGKFILSGKMPKVLKASYVGYFDTIISVAALNTSNNIIKMRPKTFELSEVEVLPGVNTAHRIIEKTTQNRDRNNPEKLKSFSYTAYHKMIFTADPKKNILSDSLKHDSLNTVSFSTKNTLDDSLTNDTISKKLDEFLKKQHLFMMESVSKRVFKQPKMSYEKIVAAKISGMDDPMLITLANSTQSFSFYGNRVAIWDKFYVNPISPGSTKKYFFHIEDTVYNNLDTVFIISFRPLKGTNFEGMKGLLYINTNGYAVQNVIAEPYVSSKTLDVKIQQQYEIFGDSSWFPVQLNTDLIFGGVQINNSQMVGIGRSYLKDIKINPPLKNSDFGNVDMEILPEASKQNSIFWDENRNDSLTIKENQTYIFLDSLSAKMNLNAKIKVIRILTQGYIHWGYVDFDLDKFLAANRFEKWRFGVGIHSSEDVSKVFKIGGYTAYGTLDKTWKYGGDLQFFIHRKTQTLLEINYKKDVEECAAQTTFNVQKFYSNDAYRLFLVEKMNYVEDIRLRIKTRSLKYLKWETGFNYGLKQILDNSYFLENVANVSIHRSSFYSAEAMIGFRWAYKEKIIRNPFFEISQGTNYPILQLRYTKGFGNVLLGEFDYNRIDFQVEKKFITNYFGKTSLVIRGGYIDKVLPWFMLYNGSGSFMSWYFEAPNSFNTMYVNEFLSDKYIELFFRHNFSKLLFKTKYFSPGIELVTNIGYGSLQASNKHQNIEYKTMEKGFYESGILLTSLLKGSINSLGIGIFYRYGPYSSSNEKKNFVFKLTNTLNF